MKKIIISALFVLTALFSAEAQSGKSSKEIRQQYFVCGPRVGLSSPTQHAQTNTTNLDAMLNGLNAGVQLGGYLRGMLPIKKTGVVLYAQLDAVWAMDWYIGKGDNNALAGCFNFPLIIGGGYKFSNGLFLRGGWGPTWTGNIFATANTSFKDTDNAYQNAVADMLDRDPWGHCSEIGVDWKEWTIDLRYHNQFRSIDYTRLADDVRFISWGIAVGYRF